jgi:hypothetical protein
MLPPRQFVGVAGVSQFFYWNLWEEPVYCPAPPGAFKRP